MSERLLIDCFLFNNELKMLEFRLEETFDIVDYYVIVESNKTFSNIDKELYFENNKELFLKYQKKIVHVIVDDMPIESDGKGNTIIGDYLNDANWTRERFQRNCIMIGLDRIKPSDNDVILINDVDEILNRETLSYYKMNGVSGLYVNAVDTYLYNLMFKVVHGWPPPRISCGSRSIDYASLVEMGGPDVVRNTYLHNKEFYPNGAVNDRKFAWIIPNSGWHFSYFGSAEFVINKIKSYSHQELNKDDIISNIQSYINQGRSISDDYSTELVNISDNKNLPVNYKMLLNYNFYTLKF